MPSPGNLKKRKLQVGTHVQLWPRDTYYKFARVISAGEFTVTFKIIRVDPREQYYKPGMRVRLPWCKVKYIKQ
ncbi:MAG: hypothetical protein K9L17_08575 [Clostridiales bacterium]|nr:hypothetical protein [Clostridiales bacterium]MCF8022730.1 hypothetical protein [Clostridiales bacterium]